MTRERKVLLGILVGVGTAAVLTIVLSTGGDRLTHAVTQISYYRGQYAKLRTAPSEGAFVATPGKIAALKSAVAKQRSRFYSPGTADPYRLAAQVEDLLRKYSISISQIRTTQIRSQTFVEYTVEGNPTALFSFLRAVSNAPKYWIIPDIHLHQSPDNRDLLCEFQIGYVEYPSSATK